MPFALQLSRFARTLAHRFRAITGVWLVLAAAACSPYLDHQDSVVSWAGDAQNANAAIMAVHPMHPGADRVRFTSDGARTARVMGRYRSGRPSADSVETADLVTTVDGLTEPVLNAPLRR
ncbi:hypothetical protein [Amorphus sp. MBR-141]